MLASHTGGERPHAGAEASRAEPGNSGLRERSDTDAAEHFELPHGQLFS